MTSKVNTFCNADRKIYICNKCYLVTPQRAARKISDPQIQKNEKMKIHYLVLGCVFVIWEAFLSVCAASQHIPAL